LTHLVTARRLAPLLTLALVTLVASTTPDRLAVGLRTTPPWAALFPGDSLRLQVPGAAAVSWTSSHPDVAAVSGDGVVRARAPGSATLVAQAGEARAYAVVVVAPPVLLGAGDIAECGRKGHEATAALLDTIAGVIFTVGDHAYPRGTPEQFAQCYGSSWGRHRLRTRPSPGNHDYDTPGAAGYFAYFGRQAGDSALGYYSWDFAGWHLVSLNSNLDMSPGSPQERWLRADLAAHPARCTLAYWHHPRFSSGRHGDWAGADGPWRALYDLGADVVVAGHDHIYERFAPQSPDAQADLARGLRQFVVGTGGGDRYDIPTVRPNSEVRDNTTFGVLMLRLEPERYHWQFVPAGDGTFSDSGVGRCH
jgi:hypothetical protein